MRDLLFKSPVSQSVPSVGLLMHRLVFGGFMLVGHGWPKLGSFGEAAAGFPDPLGIGSTASLVGAVSWEVLGAALIVLGLFTRPMAVGLMFTMAVAAFFIHGGDPLFLGGGAAKEPALIYLFGYALLLFTGPGRYSLDQRIFDRLSSRPGESRR